MYQVSAIDSTSVGLTPVFVYIATDHEDMKAERKAAHCITFPLLNIMLRKFRMCAVPVDLRSGVTRPQTYNRDCLKTAVDEIDRCRPFFLCFLGMRYGFVPFDMYETLNLPDSSQYAWIKQFPSSLSLLHYEILHAILNTTKPRADNCAHGHYGSLGVYYNSDPSKKLASLVRSAYGADYDAELSSRLAAANALHASHPIDDVRRSRHAFPRTCAPSSLVYGEEENQYIPSIPSTTLFYLRSPAFLASANFQEAVSIEEREIDVARKKIEENHLHRLECEVSEEVAALQQLAGKEPDDSVWAGDWLELYIFDAAGLIPKKSKSKNSARQSEKEGRSAAVLAAQRQVHRNILSLSRPGSRTGPVHAQTSGAERSSAAPKTATAASGSEHSRGGLEDDGGGDEDPERAPSHSTHSAAAGSSAPDESSLTRPKSALRTPLATSNAVSNQVDFAENEHVFVFEEPGAEGDSGERPDTAIQFFGDDRQLTAASEHHEDDFVNSGGGDVSSASEIKTGASELDSSSVPLEPESQNGYRLTFTYGPSVRHSKWISPASSAWNELIRIPIRQGIRLQGQGKVTIKLVKHNNNADETIGEAKLEVAKLLPHKTDFSVLRISSSVQLSLQAAFLPQRVQVIYARCLLIAADFGIIHVRS
jgi:hypothetical protein